MTTHFKRLIEDYGKRKSRKPQGQQDFEKLSDRLKTHHINLRSHSLKKLWKYLHTPEKPKGKTLDRLALFAGFQKWDDLCAALRGENDAQLNYTD